jgi:type III pantothenate kinase
LEIRVEAPERVGIDRLMGALAVNRLRQRNRPAIVIDVGTAITVDLVSAEGAFEGGAVLPGITMSAQALHEETDALPSIRLESLVEPPPPVGKSTREAMEAGVLWGAVGALRELIRRMAAECSVPPHVYLTGGTSSAVASLLGSNHLDVLHVPELVLAGIALVAEHL